MRASTSCCRHCSSRPLLAEATPGPAAPLLCRANEMPWSAEWLCSETLAAPLTGFCTCPVCLCSSEAIASHKTLALDRHKDIGTQSLISHPLSCFGLLLASFPSSVFAGANIRFSAARLAHSPSREPTRYHNKAQRLAIPDSTAVSTPYHSLAWPGRDYPCCSPWHTQALQPSPTGPLGITAAARRRE